jgi:hypothetical protein
MKLREDEMQKSEIAQIRAQIQAEYEAAKQGLTGFARHDFISAKTANIGKCHEQLVELLGPEQAISILANTIWTSTDQKPNL